LFRHVCTTNWAKEICIHKQKPTPEIAKETYIRQQRQMCAINMAKDTYLRQHIDDIYGKRDPYISTETYAKSVKRDLYTSIN